MRELQKVAKHLGFGTSTMPNVDKLHNARFFHIDQADVLNRCKKFESCTSTAPIPAEGCHFAQHTISSAYILHDSLLTLPCVALCAVVLCKKQKSRFVAACSSRLGRSESGPMPPGLSTRCHDTPDIKWVEGTQLKWTRRHLGTE